MAVTFEFATAFTLLLAVGLSCIPWLLKYAILLYSWRFRPSATCQAVSGPGKRQQDGKGPREEGRGKVSVGGSWATAAWPGAWFGRQGKQPSDRMRFRGGDSQMDQSGSSQLETARSARLGEGGQIWPLAGPEVPRGEPGERRLGSESKREFLAEYGEDYGYPEGPLGIDELRRTEFTRLEGAVYLDHAGSGLYSEQQLKEVMEELSRTLYANPHSQSESSTRTTDVVEAARLQVLAFCGALPQEYLCVFTAGATAGLRLLGEAFPWAPASRFQYTRENHNSVLGIREYALEKGATVVPVDIEDCQLALPEGGSAAPERGVRAARVEGCHWRIRERAVLRRQVEGEGEGEDRAPAEVEEVSGEGPSGRTLQDERVPRDERALRDRGELADGRALEQERAQEDESKGQAGRRRGLAASETTAHQEGKQESGEKCPKGPSMPRAAQDAPGGTSEPTQEKTTACLGSPTRGDHASRRPTANGRPPDGSLGACHLFAMPVECNFSGVRWDLDVVPTIRAGRHVARSAGSEEARDGRWFVLLDAAKACGSAPPNLTRHPADFVALSFYKMFGYPTGLGALLIRRDAAPILTKPYFGGGTVAVASADADFVRKRASAEAALEDGTLPFLAIASLRAGFAALQRFGMDPISRHVSALTEWTANQLAALRHGNGRPVVVLYGRHYQTNDASTRECHLAHGDSLGEDRGDHFVVDGHGHPQSGDNPNHQNPKISNPKAGRRRARNPHSERPGRGDPIEQRNPNLENPNPNRGKRGTRRRRGGGGGLEQGPIVAWNVVRADASWVGHKEVEKLASLSRMQLRTGCFCNPGACAKYLGLSDADMRANFEAGHVCWDDRDVIGGRPTGAVRVSYGYYSTFEDAAAVVSFVRDYFVETSIPPNVGAPKPRDVQENKETITPNKKSELCHPDDFRQSGSPPRDPIRLTSIVVYPIKSCAGVAVEAWPLSEKGLLYDREWLLVDSRGAALTQKKIPALCTLQPALDLPRGELRVTAPGANGALRIPLEGAPSCRYEGEVRVCADRTGADAYGAEVAAWCTAAVGVPCTLVRQLAQSRHVRRSLGSGSLAEEDRPMTEGHPQPAPDAASPSRQGATLGLESVSSGALAVGSMTTAGNHKGRDLALGHLQEEGVCTRGQEHGDGRGEDGGFRVQEDTETLPSSGESRELNWQGSRGALNLDSRSVGGIEQREGEGNGRGERIEGGGRGRGRGKGFGDKLAGPEGRSIERGLSFANEGQFLLVSTRSVEDLERRVASGRRGRDGGEIDPDGSLAKPGGSDGTNGTTSKLGTALDLLRFRPNLVVSGAAPYAEDSWRAVSICGELFTTLGGCSRCEMVNVDQSTGERNASEPLLTLATYRRRKGRILFGMLLARDPRSCVGLERSSFQTQRILEGSEHVRWLRARYGVVLTCGEEVLPI